MFGTIHISAYNVSSRFVVINVLFFHGHIVMGDFACMTECECITFMLTLPSQKSTNYEN